MKPFFYAHHRFRLPKIDGLRGPWHNAELAPWMTNIHEVTMPPTLANRSENDEMSIGNDFHV
jgi:hypothetical protein